MAESFCQASSNNIHKCDKYRLSVKDIFVTTPVDDLRSMIQRNDTRKVTCPAI